MNALFLTMRSIAEGLSQWMKKLQMVCEEIMNRRAARPAERGFFAFKPSEDRRICRKISQFTLAKPVCPCKMELMTAYSRQK